MRELNILYWNINYRENSHWYIDSDRQEKRIKMANNMVAEELIKEIKKDKIFAVILTEAYPQDDYQNCKKIREDLENNGFVVYPYVSNFYEQAKLVTKKDISEIPYKKVQKFYKRENDYSNCVVIAINKDIIKEMGIKNIKISNYSIDNPNLLALEIDDLVIIGTRICMCKKGKDIASSVLRMIDECDLIKGDNYIIDKKNVDYNFGYIKKNGEKSDDELKNDYIIRRANFEKFKYIFNRYNNKKVIAMGDFNISAAFSDYPVWRYENIVGNNSNFISCNANTVGDSKMDYIYTNIPKENVRFIVKTKMEMFYSKYTQEYFNEIFSINSPFPDHNLLLASIEV